MAVILLEKFLTGFTEFTRFFYFPDYPVNPV